MLGFEYRLKQSLRFYEQSFWAEDTAQWWGACPAREGPGVHPG